MVSLSQTQIATYLNDYYKLVYLMLSYPEESPYTLFTNYIYNSNNKEELESKIYYKRMLYLTYIFTQMKIFSISEDYTLKQENNFINNDDLDLSFLDSKITGNRGSISNKKLLQLLRDGFNHTTEDNELFKVSKNCKYVEFSFKNPSPITVKLSIDDVGLLTSAIADSAQTIQYLSFDQKNSKTYKEFLDNFKIYRYYLPKKVNFNTIENITRLQDEKKHSESTDIVESIPKATKKEFILTEEQKERILKTFDELIENENISIEEAKEHISELTVILLSKEIPIPIFKLDNYMLDTYFIHELLPLKQFSYADMYNIFLKGLESNEKSPIIKYKDFFDKFKRLVLKTYYTNQCERLAYAILPFCEYVLSNFKTNEEYIIIGEKTVEYKRLRNSLVHSRWTVEHEDVVFYDTLPKIELETNYNWTEKLNLYELYKYSYNIFQTKQIKEKPKQKTKSILEVKN